MKFGERRGNDRRSDSPRRFGSPRSDGPRSFEGRRPFGDRNREGGSRFSRDSRESSFKPHGTPHGEGNFRRSHSDRPGSFERSDAPRREGFDSRPPFVKRDSFSSERSEGGERRPFVKRDNFSGERSEGFSGERRPFVKRDNFSRSSPRPFNSERSEGGERAPFGRRDNFSRSAPRPFNSERSEGFSSDRRPPFVKRDNFTRSAPRPFNGERSEGFSRKFEPRAPFVKRDQQPRRDSFEERSDDQPREERASSLQGVYFIKGQLATKNSVPGVTVYDERLVNQDGVEYRLWDPTRSKLGAAIKKGVSQIGIKPGSTVLYLGCSTGTTVSHVSDIVGEEGKVFAVDLAPRVLRELLFVAQTRKNIYPILANAFLVQSFMHLVPVVDVIFMDVSQQNQAQIFLKNCAVFLKKGGFGLLALKSRSVDISQPPREIYAQTRTALEAELSIVDYRELDPFERDHAFFVCKKA